MCTTDYLELWRDLVQHGLDARVASGPDALRVTLNRLKTTIAVLEPVVEKMRGKVKPKSTHVVDSRDNDGGEPVHIDHVYSVDSRLKSSGRLWDRNFRFPSPLLGHEHELTSCDDFFSINPEGEAGEIQGKDMQNVLQSRGRLLNLGC